jgi:hypothetical protein
MVTGSGLLSGPASQEVIMNHAYRVGRWLAKLPHTFQLCIHRRENPAGFWVSRTGDKTARRPWCLCCCQGLDRNCCEIIAFGG